MIFVFRILPSFSYQNKESLGRSSQLYCGRAETTPRCISSLKVTELALVNTNPCLTMLICKYCRITMHLFSPTICGCYGFKKVTTTSQSLPLYSRIHALLWEGPWMEHGQKRRLGRSFCEAFVCLCWRLTVV